MPWYPEGLPRFPPAWLAQDRLPVQRLEWQVLPVEPQEVR